jgi:hypothetical protein
MEIPDLMTYLEAEFKRYQAAFPDTASDADNFIKFSREYLAEGNPPIQVTYLPVGIGLRLKHGEVVSFLTQQAQPMRDEGVHITKPQHIPGMHGIVSTSGVPIFGNG